MKVCPVINRVWWQVKTFMFPWVSQDNRPADVPKMKEAEDMLRTAIFDLQKTSREK